MEDGRELGEIKYDSHKVKGLARENLENYSISSLSVGINSSPVHVKRLELLLFRSLRILMLANQVLDFRINL